MNGVNEAKGIIISKEEALTKKDKKYWKFKIEREGKADMFSLWEYEAGEKVSVEDQVKLFWTEKEGTGKMGQPITYRNLNSIYREDEAPVEEVEASHSHPGVAPKPENGGGSGNYNEGAKIGMLFNNAVQLCIAEKKTKVEDIEGWFNTLRALLSQLEARK